MRKLLSFIILCHFSGNIIAQCTSMGQATDCIQTDCQKIRNSYFDCSGGWSSPGCDFLSWIPCWTVSNGDPYYPWTCPQPAGNWSCFSHEAAMVVNTTPNYLSNHHSAGIYQNSVISNGKIYLISVDYKIPSVINYNVPYIGSPGPHVTPANLPYGPLDHMYIKFSDNNSFQNYCGSYLPNPSTQQTVQHVQNITNNGNVNHLDLCVKANNDYESLWIYAQQEISSANVSNLVLDNIIMYEADAGSNQSVCTGSVTLGSGCGNIPGATFSWSPSIGLSATNILSPTLNMSSLSPGSHTYTLTINYNGCIITDQVIITKPVLPVSLGSDQLICNGSNPSLCAPAGYANYQWSVPGNCLYGNNCAVACVSGTYCVIVTDQNGCTGSDCVNITISNMPNVNIFCTDPSICPGETVTMSATTCTGCTYSWIPGGQTTSTINVSPASNTNFTVTVTNPAGCSDSQSQLVTIDDCPVSATCRYIQNNTRPDVGRAVEATSDGGFIAVGDMHENSTDRDLYVIKYRPDLSVEFSKRIGDFTNNGVTTLYNESAYAVLPVSDGYLITGTAVHSATNTDIILMKVSLTGVPQWRKLVTTATGTGLEEGRKIVKLLSASGAPTYYLVGHTNAYGTSQDDDDIYIFGFDQANGSIIGAPVTFGLNVSSEVATDAIAAQDNQHLIISGTTFGGHDDMNMYLLKITPSLTLAGVIINGGQFTDRANSVTQLGSSMYFAGSTASWGTAGNENLYIVRVNYNTFTISNTRVYSSTQPSIAETITRIITTSDNALALSGQRRNVDGLNLKIDAALNIIWSFRSTYTTTDNFMSVTEQTDGMFVLTGQYLESTTDLEFYISRTYDDGTSCCNTPATYVQSTGHLVQSGCLVVPGAAVSIKWGNYTDYFDNKELCDEYIPARFGEEIIPNTSSKESALHIFPNPSRGTFKIRMNTDEIIKEVRVYSLTGALIENFNNEESSSIMKISLTIAETGIYLTEVITDTGRHYSRVSLIAD